MSKLQPGDNLSGFEVTRVTTLKTAPAVVYKLQHPGNGARIVHYACDDPENLFSISFPTPPTDDTGIPHIMEHSVLSGSEKFPLKDPFFAMAKSSMATFLNAMTGNDCTYYPVASNVKQDMFNLANVYFDAVFHPLLTRDTFDREAHHLAPVDPDSPDGDLTVRGVVYNEMLAYAADPGYRFWYTPMVNLLEGTIYVHESGGDPDAIPDLTFERYNEFYRTFYQPANAHFFIYGDIATSEWMEFLSERMDGLVSAEIPAATYSPPPWTEPRATADCYPIGEAEPGTERTYFGLFWLAGDAMNPRERLLFKLLSTILLGNDAAPLKRAIVDSKLGTGLTGSGNSDIGPQVVFSVGLKGSEPDRGESFKSLVMRTLEGIADNGIDKGMIDAAFQQVSYESLEVTPGYPLSRMSRTLEAWIHGRDPVTFLEGAADLDECRAECDKDPDIFSRLLKERLINNKHWLFHTLTPDREWQKRRKAEAIQRMKDRREALSDEEVAAVAARAEELEQLNGEPDSPEAVASLPRLLVRDLPDEPRVIPVEWQSPGEMIRLVRNNVFANGVSYLHLAVDISGLPEDLWPCIPRFNQAFSHMGTRDDDYTEIARRKAAHTGGVHCSHNIMTSIEDPSRIVPCLMFTLKALDSELPEGLGVLEDLLFGLNPRNMDRLSVITQQALTDARRDAVQNAMGTATIHARRTVSVRGHLGHVTEGMHQLRMLEDIAGGSSNGLEGLAGKIEAIRDFIVTGGSITAGFTGSDKAFAAAQSRLSSWAGCRGPATPVDFEQPQASGLREGLAGAIDISYCSCVFQTVAYMHDDSPLLELGAHLVSHDYVLKEIRTKGTAYGAGFRYSPFDSELQIFSYRDPQIARTLSIFASLPDYVRSTDWSQDDIEQAAIAVTKAYLRPVRPGSATSETLHHGLIGLTPEIRAERFARIKSAAPVEIKRVVLETLEQNLASAPICVVSNRGKLEEANSELGDSPLAIEEILQ